MPRGGRKPKGAAIPPGTSPSSEPAPSFDDVKAALAAVDADEDAGGEPTPAPNVPTNNTAESVIGMIQTCLILIGEDEGILSESEKNLVRIPLKRVLDKYNVGANVMPSEIDLAMAVGGLIIARLGKPKTATWFAKVRLWFINFFFRRKGAALAAEMRREVPAARPI